MLGPASGRRAAANTAIIRRSRPRAGRPRAWSRHATVLTFPDLDTGNNTYKAVQRSASAIAIGPVLQGLRRPVNDLSRGALVQDIVNTAAITGSRHRGGTQSPARRHVEVRGAGGGATELLRGPRGRGRR
ncbi:phosphate acyltransferase [Kitasatospora sp. NPDC001660]